MSSRRTKILFLVLWTPVFILSVGALVRLYWQDTDIAPSIATLMKHAGDVKLKDKRGVWTEISDGRGLIEGDWLWTADKSTASVEFLGGTMLDVGEGAVIQIKRARGLAANAMVVELLKGTIAVNHTKAGANARNGDKQGPRDTLQIETSGKTFDVSASKASLALSVSGRGIAPKILYASNSVKVSSGKEGSSPIAAKDMLFPKLKSASLLNVEGARLDQFKSSAAVSLAPVSPLNGDTLWVKGRLAQMAALPVRIATPKGGLAADKKVFIKAACGPLDEDFPLTRSPSGWQGTLPLAKLVKECHAAVGSNGELPVSLTSGVMGSGPDGEALKVMREDSKITVTVRQIAPLLAQGIVSVQFPSGAVGGNGGQGLIIQRRSRPINDGIRIIGPGSNFGSKTLAALAANPTFDLKPGMNMPDKGVFLVKGGNIVGALDGIGDDAPRVRAAAKVVDFDFAFRGQRQSFVPVANAARWQDSMKTTLAAKGRCYIISERRLVAVSAKFADKYTEVQDFARATSPALFVEKVVLIYP